MKVVNCIDNTVRIISIVENGFKVPILWEKNIAGRDRKQEPAHKTLYRTHPRSDNEI